MSEGTGAYHALVAEAIAALCFQQRHPDTYSHTLRVASQFHDGSRENVVALLHDTLEDAPDLVTPELLHRFFPMEVVWAVEWLTRKDDQSYWDYILGLAEGTGDSFNLARAVKLADANDNLMRSLGQSSRQRRYERVIEILEGGAHDRPRY